MHFEPNKICPKENVEKDDYFEDIFVPDTEEESVQEKKERKRTIQEAGLIQEA